MATLLPQLAVNLGKLPLSTRRVLSQPSPIRVRAPSPSPTNRSRAFSAQPLRFQRDPGAQPARKLTYHVAAAFCSKRQKFNPLTHVFHFNPYNRIQTEKKQPKSKRPASGQDAFFVSRVGDTNAVAFGVADGVGGWEDSGVDPADFAHSFCDYMASAAHGYKPESGESQLTPTAVMQRGYDDVCKDRTLYAGGSTASVAIANENGKLDVANLGDSGFAILRLNAVHAFSEPQTHAFNTPYQLSLVPASMLARAAAFGGAQLCDNPKDADVTQHNLKHGDIVMIASDGVWDNLFNQDILRIASRLMTDTGAWKTSEGGIRVVDDLRQFTEPLPDPTQRPTTLQSLLAIEITAAAKVASASQRIDGPFAKEVHKYYPQENWHGGKIDDICVVILLVSDHSKLPDAQSKL
ncbi:protein serine/threonine phosphatase 2C [Xylaria sp. CBS 124048]|nr:protein serine/threonine phosphatase 2C [Xylaria sp. CBS 124048]